MVISFVSWPGFARPPTTYPVSAPQVVDGRHMAGHDTVGAVTPQGPYFNAYADKPGHDGVATDAAMLAPMVQTRHSAVFLIAGLGQFEDIEDVNGAAQALKRQITDIRHVD